MLQPSVFPKPMPKPPARPGPGATPVRLHAAMRALLRRVDAVDVRRYVSSSEPPTALEAAVRGIASDVRAFLDDVAAWYGGDGAATLDPISDTATLGRMELGGHQEALARAAGAAWQRVASCDSALQVCRRCLRMLDRLVADAEGLPRSPDVTAGETEVALGIRRAYVDLHRTVTGNDLPDEDTIAARLRASGNTIARVLGCPAAHAMRVHDLYMLRVFQSRIRAALLDPPAGPHGHDHLIRVWQDLTNFTSLLLDVSKRDELRAHDRDLVERTLARVETLPGHVPAPRVILDALRACEGRDPELDLLLGAECSASTLRACLQRLRDGLSPRPGQRPPQRTSGTWSGVL